MLPAPGGFFHGVGPAGGISVSAADLARWMQVQLARGTLPNDGRLYSEAQAAELWRPVVVVPPDEFKLPAPWPPCSRTCRPMRSAGSWRATAAT